MAKNRLYRVILDSAGPSPKEEAILAHSYEWDEHLVTFRFMYADGSTFQAASYPTRAVVEIRVEEGADD